jgi:hypothetical protein
MREILLPKDAQDKRGESIPDLEKGSQMKRPPRRLPLSTMIPIFLAVAIGLSSCGGPVTQTLYLQFRQIGEPGPSSAFTVGVVPFEDFRPSPQSVGKRIRTDGTVEPIVLGSPIPSKDLTYMLIRYLENRGIRVVDLPYWDTDPNGLRDLPKGIKLAVAGRIDALEVETNSTLLTCTVRYKVRLTTHLGLVEKGEVLTRSMEISPQRTYVQFDIREVEDGLNRALLEVMGRLMEGVLPANN